MKTQQSIYVLFVAILGILMFNGCGGGSGGSTPIQPNPKPTDATTFTVQPYQAASHTFNNEVKVDIPADTFATKANVTVTQNAPQALPPIPTFQTLSSQAEIHINIDHVPRQPITISFPNRSASRDNNSYTYILATKKPDGAWQKVNNLSHEISESASYIVDPDKFILTGAVANLDVIAGKFIVTTPSDKTSLETLISDPLGNPNICGVVLHGFNGTIDNSPERPIANALAKRHYYGTIYGFGYDYRRSGDAVATDFANTLNDLKNRGLKIDIYSHSWGGAVTRDALEVKGATKNVMNVNLLSAANEGSVLANIDDFINYYQDEYLNLRPTANQPLGILTYNAPVIKDVQQNSLFFQNLNNVTVGFQRGVVNYNVYATLNDGVVGYPSAIGYGIDFRALTGGAVNLFTMVSGGHSDWLYSDAGLNTLLAHAFGALDSNALQITFDQNPCEANYDGWNINITLTNTGGNDLVVDDLVIVGYDANGDWIVQEWYDPNDLGTLYPETLYLWSYEIPSQMSTTIYDHCYTDFNFDDIDSAPAEYQTKTMVVIARYHDWQNNYVSQSSAQLVYNGKMPAQAKTRLAPLANIGLMHHGIFGPAKNSSPL